MKLWILVANRTQARVFNFLGRRKGIRLVKELSSPEGRLQNRELDSDRAGRSFSSDGTIRHGLGQRSSSSEHLNQVFAASIVEYLSHERSKGEFEDLILVAEPGFLGLLRKELPKELKLTIVDSVTKDLVHVSEAELPEYLKEAIEGYSPLQSAIAHRNHTLASKTG